MPRINADQEREREEIVFRAVQNNPGLKQSELVAHTGLESRTLNNYLNKLETRGKLYRDQQRWFVTEWHVDQKLRPIELTAEQAMSLYIAARALARVQDERNETAESALIALSKALVGDFNVGVDIHKAAADLAHRPERSGYNKVYRELMRACVYRKKIRITYETAKGHRFETDFEPYLFEPSLFGFSIYAIGYSDIAQAYRSYKLERIKNAELLRADFDSRKDAPMLTTLKSAWSIMFGDETETVELEFTPEVRKRVLETNWHISQRTDSVNAKLSEPLIWQVDVADATDMLPWVRGWGADAVVKQPEWIRSDVINHVRRLSLVYGIATPNSGTPAHHLLWAKADKTTGRLHRLAYHMIDVGMCALALWRHVLNANLKQRLADWLRLTADDAGRLIGFWASLHDLGKASPAFQDHSQLYRASRSTWTRVRDELRAAGLNYPMRPGGDEHARHETVSMWSLQPNNGENLLGLKTALPVDLARLIAQMLSGHHGAFHSGRDTLAPRLSDKDIGDLAWADVRSALFDDMRVIFRPPPVSPFEENPDQDTPNLILLAGLISAADWLGSDETAFPLIENELPLGDYARHAENLARLSLFKADWQAAPAVPHFDFGQMFGFDRRPAQAQAHDALRDTPLPALAIVELPMGNGKTEIALEALAGWMRRDGLSGAYIAMPTTATSNQMHERASAFLQKLIGGVTPLLVHSQALLRDAPTGNADASDMSEPGETIEEDRREGEQAAAQAWFLPRKKSLLAPFGVGTVDQAFMSVLQTKHFFVRLLGLSHKLVIFDEVHAYDAYMSVLFDRLLVWLSQIGASVVILSATLSNETRKRLVKAYCGKTIVPDTEYPRLTIAPLRDNVTSVELAKPETRRLAYEWIADDVSGIVDRLRAELAQGGCAAVICNTVTRAQTIYKAIKDARIIEDEAENLILFHARFPMAWREDIERKVLGKFGPDARDKRQRNQKRPHKAIVVATQVIEQSLDLDFDVMISDYAPADLLLQRTGRLHRHAVNDAARVHSYRLLIVEPVAAEGLPQLSRADKLVYDEFTLLRSWLALKHRPLAEVALPDDMSGLIEQVYGDSPLQGITPTIQAALDRSKQDAEKKAHEERYEARQRIVPKPGEDVMERENLELEEDNVAVHEAFQAYTRSDRPGVNVVCLHRINGQLYLDPEGATQAYDPRTKPDKSRARDLARQALAIRRWAVEKVLLQDPLDDDSKIILSRWKKVAALRYHRVLIFDAGVCKLGDSGYTLRLSREYGLEISKP
jgi:CRISPR-associated endonuclease/helicase Cas3